MAFLKLRDQVCKGGRAGSPGEGGGGWAAWEPRGEVALSEAKVFGQGRARSSGPEASATRLSGQPGQRSPHAARDLAAVARGAGSVLAALASGCLVGVSAFLPGEARA